jgi:hypothetical protein
MIFLDYFWLDPRWYEFPRNHSYGPLWFVERGQIAHCFKQCAKLKYFILPVDAPGQNLPEHKKPESESYLLTLLANSYVAKHFDVLSDATVTLPSSSHRGSCSLQLEDNTPEQGAFVLVARTKLATHDLFDQNNC